MPLVISDELLHSAGKSEGEVRQDLAFRWFDEGRLSLTQAAELAALSRQEFEERLELRNVPRYRYTSEMLEQDVETLKKLGRW